MTNPYAASPYGQPNRPRRGRRGPIATIIIGSLLMVLGPILGLVISVVGLIDRIDPSALEDQQAISNPGTTEPLQPGGWVVYSPELRSDFSCSVTSSGGQELPTTTTQYQNVRFDLYAVDAVNVECNAGSELYVFQAAIFDDLMGDAAQVAGPVLVGMGLGFLGFLALVGGIIWLVIRNRQIREQDAGGGYGTGYGLGGGYGQPLYGPDGFGSGGPGAGGYGPGAYGPGGSGPGGPGPGAYGSGNYGDGYGTGPSPSGYSSGDPFGAPPRYGDRSEPPRYGERRPNDQDRDEPSQ